MRRRRKFGDIVMLRMDPEQLPRIITGMTLRPHNSVQYALSIGADKESWHFDIEIVDPPDEKPKAGFRR